MKLLLTPFITVAFSFSSHAQSNPPPLLSPFPNQPQFQFDPNVDTEIPNCANILERLRTLQENNREAQFGLIEFMDVSGQKVGEWHSVLSPLEETNSPSIPKGSFDVLIQGSDSILELTSLAYQNLDFLDRDFDSIIQGIESCIKKGGN